MKWIDNSNENSNFILLYKHENDEKWENVPLEKVYKHFNSTEYRVQYTIPYVQPGRYICQIQSKSDIGIIQKSDEAYAYEKVEVSSYFRRFLY